MVELNVTLFLQIIHFLGAYVLLRRFLWRPVVVCIELQDNEKLLLDKELERQQQFVEQKEFEIERLWREARRSFLVHTPNLMKTPTIEHKVAREYEHVELDVSVQMIDELTKEIVEKVQE